MTDQTVSVETRSMITLTHHAIETEYPLYDSKPDVVTSTAELIDSSKNRKKERKKERKNNCQLELFAAIFSQHFIAFIVCLIVYSSVWISYYVCYLACGKEMIYIV